MNDIEDLLRDTLTDARRKLPPAPGMYEAIERRARQRRHQRSLVALAAACVVALAVGGSLVGVHASSNHHAAKPAKTATGTPSPSATASPSAGGLSDLVIPDVGWVTAMAVTPGGLYALTTNPVEIVRLDITTHQILARAKGPSGSPTGIAVWNDQVIAWSQDSGEMRTYSADRLSMSAVLDSKLQVFNVVALNGVWMTTNDGLYRWSPVDGQNGPSQLTKVAGITGPTYSLAADASRNRVLVGVMPDVAASSGAASSGAASSSASASGAAFAGAQIDAVDVHTDAITRGAVTGVGKEEIAVVDGQVWVGGYGDGALLLHLDRMTLQLTPDQPKQQVGLVQYPGVILWPGSNVLWLRNGGSEALGCLDPATGAVLEEWDTVEGPVTSIPGHAYALTPSPKTLQLTGHCTG